MAESKAAINAYVQGSANPQTPGCVKIRWKSCILLPAVGRRAQHFGYWISQSWATSSIGSPWPLLIMRLSAFQNTFEVWYKITLAILSILIWATKSVTLSERCIRQIGSWLFSSWISKCTNHKKHIVYNRTGYSSFGRNRNSALQNHPTTETEQNHLQNWQISAKPAHLCPKLQFQPNISISVGTCSTIHVLTQSRLSLSKTYVWLYKIGEYRVKFSAARSEIHLH